jgi:hypothetical protein
MPEINVFNLKANLLQLMEYRATTDVEDQESQDYDMIVQLESTGLLPNFPTQVLLPPVRVRVRVRVCVYHVLLRALTFVSRRTRCIVRAKGSPT